MKTSSPYGPGQTVKHAPETSTGELGKADGKAKARYPHRPLMPGQANSQSAKMQKGAGALTPGTSPTDS